MPERDKDRESRGDISTMFVERHDYTRAHVHLILNKVTTHTFSLVTMKEASQLQECLYLFPTFIEHKLGRQNVRAQNKEIQLEISEKKANRNERH